MCVSVVSLDGHGVGFGVGVGAPVLTETLSATREKVWALVSLPTWMVATPAVLRLAVLVW